MKWKVSYYDDSVMHQILKLPKTLLARYLRTVNLIEVFGANLGEPHSKAFGNGLFELRLKGKEGIARVFYCTVIGKEVIMLHSFIKKTQKTPARELEIARLRLKEIKDEKK
jgi:phage-related protein